jgi:hypothetical protein
MASEDGDMTGNLEIPGEGPVPGAVISRKRAMSGKALKAYVRIMLEENENSPPSGVMVGVNGRVYCIQPGVEVDVPQSVLEILDHAVMEKPVLNPGTKQIVGTRIEKRHPYQYIG